AGMVRGGAQLPSQPAWLNLVGAKGANCWMGFPEFYKELEAEISGDGAKLMGIQFIQLELRLGKTHSRSFRPVKSAEILWQFWASSSFGVSLAHDSSWSK
ncbi:hypothetical protein Tco_0618650, partial [Tanacetum coccineum]